MHPETVTAVLDAEGFRELGLFDYDFLISFWWHAEHKIEVSVAQADAATVIKTTKSYLMEAIAESAAETYCRDINGLIAFLEHSLPQFSISFSYLRNITKSMALRRIREKRLGISVQGGTADGRAELESINTRRSAVEEDLRSAQAMIGLLRSRDGLLASYLRKRCGQATAELTLLRDAGKRTQNDLAIIEHLQKQYLDKGAAALFLMTYSANLQIARGEDEFRDRLKVAVKEILDSDRYLVKQKLSGGRLQIYIREVTEPALAWWLRTGAVSPVELEKLSSDLDGLRGRVETAHMVTPSHDISVSGSVRDQKRPHAGWILQSIMQRLDRAGRPDREAARIPDSGRLAWLGFVTEGHRFGSQPCMVDVDHLNGCYVAGITRSGKSMAGRCLLEGCLAFDDINVLVLDPINQGVGLLLPEDREDMLAKYAAFRMKREQARGFEARYYAPGLGIGGEIPADLSELGRGRNILSFKGMADGDRCNLFGRVVEAVFQDHAGEETDRLKTIVYVDEAHLFTKTRVRLSKQDAAAAEKSELWLDRLIRQGNKNGLCAVVLTQGLADFARIGASIRSNTNTKLFFRNSDREVIYASDYLPDSKVITSLRTGTAMLSHPDWGVYRVAIRPPLSKVFELSTLDTRRVVEGSDDFVPVVSREAESLLAVVERLCGATGMYPNLAEAARRAGITSKRRLQNLANELERAGRIRMRTGSGRGAPKMIVPCGPGPAEGGPNADETRAGKGQDTRLE